MEELSCWNPDTANKKSDRIIRTGILDHQDVLSVASGKTQLVPARTMDRSCTHTHTHTKVNCIIHWRQTQRSISLSPNRRVICTACEWRRRWCFCCRAVEQRFFNVRLQAQFACSISGIVLGPNHHASVPPLLSLPSSTCKLAPHPGLGLIFSRIFFPFIDSYRPSRDQ